MAQWLERAERLARRGDEWEALRVLKGVLRPILVDTQALEIWMELMGRLEPQEEKTVRRALQTWIERAEAWLKAHPSRPPSAETTGGLVSPTLARLYWGQGHRDKAVEVFRTLLRRDPGNAVLLKEFQACLSQMRREADEKMRRLQLLEEWTRRLRRRRRQIEASDPGSAEDPGLANDLPLE